MATVPWNSFKIIVGYRWAVYGTLTPDGKLIVYKDWKNFSQDTGNAITALEAAAARSVSGAPAIELPAERADWPPEQSRIDEEPLHVRTKNSKVPDLFPDDLYVKEV